MWFNGTKCALFIGADLVVLRRDDFPTIPYPNKLDLPGGEREGDETPQEVATREIYEEIGLHVPPEAMHSGRVYSGPCGRSWFFVAEIDAGRECDIVFGDEGQGWELMSADAFARHPDRIDHLADLVLDYLAGRAAG